MSDPMQAQLRRSVTGHRIQPIETRYRGYLFRSRLEARWAVFFDEIGIPWSYENDPVCVDGENYLPDFVLEVGDKRIVHEVKSLHERERIKPPVVYLAGKMSSDHDWRPDVSRQWACPAWPFSWPRTSATWGGIRFICNGPYHMDCGHSCTCGCEPLHSVMLPSFDRDSISAACLKSIATCDIFCAHFSTTDAFGTLVELGIARGYGKKICTTFDIGMWRNAFRISVGHSEDDVHDLWFAEQVSEQSSDVSCFASARAIHADFIRRNSPPEFRKIAALAAGSDGSAITFGDPVDVSEKNCAYMFGSMSVAALCRDNPAAAAKARAARFGT